MKVDISTFKIKVAGFGITMAVISAATAAALGLGCSLADIGLGDAFAFSLIGIGYGLLCGLSPSIGLDKQAAQAFVILNLAYVAIASNSLRVAICMLLPNILIAAAIAVIIQYRQALAIIAQCTDLDYVERRPHHRRRQSGKKRNRSKRQH